MHQETKIVKVGDLPADERQARGLTDMPDSMEVSIVVADIVKKEPSVPSKTLQLQPDQVRKPIDNTPSSELPSE